MCSSTAERRCKGDQLGPVDGVAVGHHGAMHRLLKRLGGVRSLQLRPVDAASTPCSPCRSGLPTSCRAGAHSGPGAPRAGRRRSPSRWLRANTARWAMQRALQQYSTKTCCIRQYSSVAWSRAHCVAMQQYNQYSHTAIHHHTPYSTMHPTSGAQTTWKA